MTLNEARTIVEETKNLGCMEAARRGAEFSPAWNVISAHAVAKEDAERVETAVLRARSNDRLSGTFLVSLAQDPRGTMAYDVSNAVARLAE